MRLNNLVDIIPFSRDQKRLIVPENELKVTQLTGGQVGEDAQGFLYEVSAILRPGG